VFPGHHSDIGGGHKEDQNLLAVDPLLYIHGRGIAAGTPFGNIRIVNDGGIYLEVGGQKRPWPYKSNIEPHNLTGFHYLY
jgi:hypothetical protein